MPSPSPAYRADKEADATRYLIECTACGFVSVFVHEPKAAVCAHCFALIGARATGKADV